MSVPEMSVESLKLLEQRTPLVRLNCIFRSFRWFSSPPTGPLPAAFIHISCFMFYLPHSHWLQFLVRSFACCANVVARSRAYPQHDIALLFLPLHWAPIKYKARKSTVWLSSSTLHHSLQPHKNDGYPILSCVFVSECMSVVCIKWIFHCCFRSVAALNRDNTHRY